MCTKILKVIFCLQHHTHVVVDVWPSAAGLQQHRAMKKMGMMINVWLFVYRQYDLEQADLE